MVFKNNIISVFRKNPHNLVWSADLNTLVLSEQFNQVFTSISSNIVHGLGEHKDTYEKMVKNRKQVLFFNRDEPPRPGNFKIVQKKKFKIINLFLFYRQSTLRTSSILPKLRIKFR